MRSEQKYGSRIAALFIGVMYVMISSRIQYLATGGWLSIYVPAVALLFPVLLLLTLYSDGNPWLNLAYFFPGLVIGVSVDVLLFHSKVHGIVWLFEAIGFCVLLAPIAVSATAFGRFIGRRRKTPGNGLGVHHESQIHDLGAR
jgi:hypothetical protein